ncbi:hypothetical protein [Oceanihabitans sediminis]|uniref:hypothetical protein n=2 Tax=Oceanihabitans sediminis TaxID=1812012 RepID=UPI00299F45CC|nr:hypothetical protein [Oceanihabitans sediminis]MDX1278786.1 hypothetical protein [Oceanihabitans sediminis]
MKIEFKEERKFHQWWLWLILISIGFLPILVIYKQLILGEAFGDKPMPDIGVVFFSLFIFSLIALFWFLKLKTEINQKEIKISLFPFIKQKQISWEKIKTAEVINYGFVGGWGIRLGTKYGTVYNTRGNIGLKIELYNGTKLLIGTQREQELKAIIEKLRKEN